MDMKRYNGPLNNFVVMFLIFKLYIKSINEFIFKTMCLSSSHILFNSDYI